jgi:hypothetical protein
LPIVIKRRKLPRARRAGAYFPRRAVGRLANALSAKVFFAKIRAYFSEKTRKKYVKKMRRYGQKPSSRLQSQPRQQQGEASV